MARTILTRCMAVMALLFVYGAYLVGATVLLATTSTQAQARRWRGRRGGGIYWAAVSGLWLRLSGLWLWGIFCRPRPRCYWSRRWRRTICRY